MQVVHGEIDPDRAMGRVVEVDEIVPHTNADRMELAVIGGWQVCVTIGDFKKGDRGVYFEIDSLVPMSNPELAFLTKRTSDLKQVGDQTYCRITSMKFRGEISQGLLVPLMAGTEALPVGTDVSELLGVLKYQRPGTVEDEEEIIDDTLVGKFIQWVSGPPPREPHLPWPARLVKSRQERVQNLKRKFEEAYKNEDTFEISVKLDGTSATAYAIFEDGEVRSGICNRTVELRLDDDTWTFGQSLRRWVAKFLSRNRRVLRNLRIIIPEWRTGTKAMDDVLVRMFLTSGLREKLVEAALRHGEVAVQGEFVGEGIEKNREGIEGQKFFVYTVYKVGSIPSLSVRLAPEDARNYAYQLELEYVPVIEKFGKLEPTMNEVLAKADGKAFFNPKKAREGLVYKSNSSPFSFKVISNKALLKQSREEE